MSRRFGMILRKKAGQSPTTTLLRPRRRTAPPKKDDLSGLTWKERQMIEKAQLASLKTSLQKNFPSRGVDGNGESSDESSDSGGPPASSSGNEIESSTSPASLEARSNCDGARPAVVKNRYQRCTASESRRSSQNRLSSNMSPSRRSFGSFGSVADLLLSRQAAPSGGFAARKSAYTGAVSDSDEDTDGRSVDSFGFEDDSNASRKLPPIRSLPTTEDFLKYLVLKGINCVPENLRYIGDLPWETMRVKRKNVQKKQVNGNSPSSVTLSSPPVVPKPKQMWAKKAIERAKKSLIVKHGNPISSPVSPAKSTELNDGLSGRRCSVVARSLSSSPKRTKLSFDTEKDYEIQKKKLTQSRPRQSPRR